MRIAVLVVLFLVGCVNNQKAVTEYASDGSVMKSSVAMSGKQYIRLEAVKSAEKTRAACYAAQSSQQADSDLGRVALVLANKDIDCGAGYNEVLIAEEQGKTARWQAGIGGILGIAKVGGASYVGGKLIDRLGRGVSVTNNGNSNQTSLGDTSPNSNSFEQSGELSAKAACEAKGGEYRAATAEEIESGVAVDGFICSDGNGGAL